MPTFEAFLQSIKLSTNPEIGRSGYRTSFKIQPLAMSHSVKAQKLKKENRYQCDLTNFGPSQEAKKQTEHCGGESTLGHGCSWQWILFSSFIGNCKRHMLSDFCIKISLSTETVITIIIIILIHDGTFMFFLLFQRTWRSTFKNVKLHVCMYTIYIHKNGCGFI